MSRVEADWPDAYRVINCFVRAENDDGPEEALGDVRRFPTWMWRSADLAEFVGWLRGWNDSLAPGSPKAGFYGLDLYSLHTSMEAVVLYLDEADPDAAGRARERYACFDQFGRDPQVYAYEAGIAGAEPCEQQAGELNLGQLVRERYGLEALLVGFTTYTGTVTAASDWGGPAERKRIRPALGGTWEELFHGMDAPDLLLGTGGLEGRRLERAMGVVYRPETERISHYFHATLAKQFDLVLHIDETTAVEPLEVTSEWKVAEVPETSPWGSRNGGQTEPRRVPTCADADQGRQGRPRRQRRLERTSAVGTAGERVSRGTRLLGVREVVPGSRRRAQQGAQGHYKFPYGDFEKVHRCAVLSAESRAGQYKHEDVKAAAAHLHGMLEALN